MSSIPPSPNIVRWLIFGRGGLSAKTMATVALGYQPSDINHPHDPDDFNRCLLLIDAAPEVREAFPQLAKLSPTWKALITRWDEIEALFLEEAGLNYTKGHSSERTWKLMRRIFRSIEY